tara:strand:- start:1583 stop:1804 length:222 start_codon:yes stop_codon:yes gene_type:complete
MNFAKNFLKKNPINISHINNSSEILPLQYKFLAPQYLKGGPIKIPHSYSNKIDRQKMRNTLELLNELFKNKTN